jgi:osmotically-inducible protein OsmY
MHHYYEDDEPRRYRGERVHGRGEGDREWNRRGRDDRGVVERAGDEVRSWFGDEEAERRRRMDERYDRYESRGGRGRAWEPERERDFDERAWAKQWGYLEGRREPGYYGERSWGSERPSGFGGRGGFDRGGWADRERSWTERPWGEESLTRGRHFGKGPRTYQRSDERIRDEVCERLAHCGDVDATDVDIQVRSGEVTLGGRVNSRQEKRIAEDVAESVWGITELHNQIRVTPEGESGTRESGQAGPPGWQSRAA